MTKPIALVTGASRGLGREVARRLVAEGLTVLAGVRHPAEMEHLPGVEVLPLDVSDPGLTGGFWRDGERIPW